MKNKQRHFLSTIAGLLGYALGLVALNYFDDDKLPYRYGLVLLPLIPMIYMVASIIRSVSEMDEMWRKIVSEAMAFSALATGFTCFSYLFLRDMGAPEFRPEWAFYMMWFYYAVGVFFSRRRYQ